MVRRWPARGGNRYKKIGPIIGSQNLTNLMSENDNKLLKNIGDWPSGKAAGSGPVIGGSNPSSPAKIVLNWKLSPERAAFSLPNVLHPHADHDVL